MIGQYCTWEMFGVLSALGQAATGFVDEERKTISC